LGAGRVGDGLVAMGLVEGLVFLGGDERHEGRSQHKMVLSPSSESGVEHPNGSKSTIAPLKIKSQRGSME